MEIFKTIGEYRIWRQSLGPNKSVGFVPTMGALHQGHLSLVQKSQENNHQTVVSIFVNPLQFGPSEDFTRYPRPIEKDIELCKNLHVSALFAPEVSEFYQDKMHTFVNVQELDKYLCGATRPGHFQGVCTVVLKLCNVILPTRVYLGQKDIQQAFILKKMIFDLSVNLEIKIVETVREPSGLALSSRNIFLSPEEKKNAESLSRGLAMALNSWGKGEKDSLTLITIAKKEIENSNPTQIDYIELVSQKNLAPIESITVPAILAVAVFYGKTRLIDNVLIEKSESN